MYELVKLSDISYYVNCPAKIGIVKIGGDDVVLIDSGSDKDAGKKVRKILDAEGWHLTAIYNTHSHADHIGGNRYLVGQTGCRVYAPGIEAAFTRFPQLESAYLYGAKPPRELCGKFLCAEESPAEPLTEAVLPAGFELIPLPGHFFDMVGFRTPDGIVWLADCLSSVTTLEKYGVGFIYDIAGYIDTLQKVKEMSATVFVPSHADVTEDVSELCDYNINKVLKIADVIADLCVCPICFDELLRGVFDTYSLTMTFEQYALVGSTVRSYLTYLKGEGRVSCEILDNKMLWSKI